MKKFLAGAAVLALIAGSASAQTPQQQEQGGTRTAQGTQQQDQKSGQSTSPAAQKDGAAPSQAQGGGMKEPEGRSQASPQKPEMKRDANEATDKDTKRAQDRDATPQRQGQTQDKKDGKNGQAQTESKPGGGKAANVELNSEQRTKISQTIKTQNVKRVTNVNFNISVGTVVPRNYTFYPVPATVVAVVPAYRGYVYIVVGDQMLILHPRTHEIVAIIAV